MSDALEQTLRIVWPPPTWCDFDVVVAVSGGADSVALLRLLHTIKRPGSGRLHVAHFNHHLRGGESDEDQRFVVALAAQLGLDCVVRAAQPGEMEALSGDGLEAAARHARYDFLRQTAERLGARYVVTGHTADDQAETILQRIVRGSGIAGLSGMRRVRVLGPAVTVIRPLLGVRRGDVLAYLARLEQPYRDDSSNTDRRFTRNRIRHDLLPALAEHYNAGVVEALLRLGALSGEVQAVIDQLVDPLFDAAVTDDAAGLRIDAARVAGQPRYLIRELFVRVWRARAWPLQSMGYVQWEQLAEMLAASVSGSPPQQVYPGRILVRAEAGQLWLSVVRG